MNSLYHLLDYRRSNGLRSENVHLFMISEIYLDRVRKCLSKKMKSEWNILLSVEYLTKIDCWATLDELQLVIPYHGDKFTQILLNATTEGSIVSAHDLSFCTAYIISILFLMVKASRPMTFIYLTVKMIRSIAEGGIIDQTAFKTQAKYGFDSLIFTKDVIDILNGFITCIRPRLNPICDYLLISKNGTQLIRISDIFGRLVFQAIGKYIHPTRYRQIIETESAEKLTVDEQNTLSEDQKHTSYVAKVHYQKLQSRHVAEKGKQAMEKLRDGSRSINTLQTINHSISASTSKGPDFVVEGNTSNIEIQKTKKKTAFSKLEDKFLTAAIKKYRGGKWTSILGDADYKFHSSRKPATLFSRAKLLKLI